MKEKTRRNILQVIILLLALLYVGKFGKAAVLRTYIELGIGDCKKIPVFCILPHEEIITPHIDKVYLAQLVPFEFTEEEPTIAIYLPKEFTVVRERINKVYYKKAQRRGPGSICYLLYEQPGFFTGLFPKMAKQGVENDYEFIRRTMYAAPKDIKNLTDTFFVIMKSIFTPNLGDEKNIQMVKFQIGDKKGFLTYNLTESENYFDCNIFNKQGDFFKVYIKDRAVNLDLDKVLTIISTISKTGS